MKKKEKEPTKFAPVEKKEEALKDAPAAFENEFAPVFVEPEKMFERFDRLNREISRKAFENFLTRGEFGAPFDDWLKAEQEVLLPVPVEITENKKQFKILADLHGFKPEEVEVCIKNNLLILSGENDTEEVTEYTDSIFTEWHHNRFFRAFPLSDEVDADKIKANWKDGFLQLTLPKLPEPKPNPAEVKEA
jgi:HSP20 family protein